MAIKILAVLLALMTATLFAVGLYNVNKVKPEFPVPTQPQEKKVCNEGVYDLQPQDILVDPNGEVKSIAEAKQLLKTRGGSDAVTVWFKGGDYLITEPLLFTSQDRGNVTYRNMPGEAVYFSGAVPISGWQADTVNGVACWSKQMDTTEANWYFKSLYHPTQQLRRPQYPTDGYLFVEKPDRTLSRYTQDNTPWEYTRGDMAFYAKAGDLRNFYHIDDVTVRIMHYWKDEIMNAVSYDAASRMLQLRRPSSMIIRENDRYILENVFESLNAPGEWYLDSQSGKLWYIPFAGEQMGSAVLYAGKTELLLQIDGASNLSFKGITFRNTEWNIPKIPAGESWLGNDMDFPQAAYDVTPAIEVQNARLVVFEGCNFKNIGSSALRFGVNVQDCAVRACRFFEIGGIAVYIRGENLAKDAPTVTRNITVTDNHIYRYGRRFFNAIGILLIHANSCELSNNEIHDGFYTGISVGWVWGYTDNVTDNIQVKDNLIYDIGQGWLSDMGGIYTLGMQPNTVLSGNVIHNVAADPLEGGYGGWGIYLDEGSSGILVENNLCYDMGSQGFHQHYGKENKIRNNIFALNKEGQFLVSRKEDHTSLYLEGNILVGDKQLMYKDPKTGQFKDNKNLYFDYSCCVEVFSGKSMKLFDNKDILLMKLSGYYNDAVFADPWFRDAKGFDFTLAVNSPAIQKIGFVPWDYSKAGTITKLN